MPRNTDTNKRYSVCIGINVYAPEAGLAPLNYAENDARSMDEMLGELGFASENRRLLLGNDATLTEVNSALREMILNRPQENDLVVFYFAGHSEPVTIEERPDRRSEVFLTTYDFDRQRIKDDFSFRTLDALSMGRLHQTFFEMGRSTKRFFLLDSCYSGAFYGSGSRGETDGVRGRIGAMLDSRSTGRVSLSSCLNYQKAVESSRYDHGLFTYYVLQALGGKASDALQRDGTLTVGDLFNYVSRQLPPEQRPVMGGVQQDTFVLTRYPELAVNEISSRINEKEPGRDARLRSMYADQVDYVQDRLDRFVGRETELKALHERIAGKMEAGGYVVIKGDAGQGKSSIIAKLIEGQGIDTCAYHFVQTGSGFNYQINVLRNLMARLIMKYDLPEYYVTGESYPILCGNFLGVLKAIAEKKAQEVIYIDGLDQLEMDPSAIVPNLSFLPSRLPAGIVIVMGTRPNKTLDEVLRLIQLKPDESYPLQGLSREDFDLLLQRHEVPLSVALSNSLYQRLTDNPLYLDLVAQELRASHSQGIEELIARVESNPNDIFSITFSRMEQASGWDDVIRPMLGVLLVAQEPLSSQQIAHIIQQGNARVNAGITQLGGLLTPAGKMKHTLFHPKLKEYLKQGADERGNAIQFGAEEVEVLHGQIAKWCEQGPIEELWLPLLDPAPRDDYQEYAQSYYIFHLYEEARRYERLFEVLDKGDYERGKLSSDKSTRSSAADLLLGCQAAARRAKTLMDGKNLLLHLWRYTLLRTNLTTRADAYPVAAFQALLDLGREQVALDLAELLTQPARKLAVLILITEYFLKQPERETKGIQLSSRVYEMATSTQDNETRIRALGDLAMVLVNIGQLVQAEDIARLIVSDIEQAIAFNDISDAYGKQSNWDRAEEVAGLITIDEERVKALSYLAAKLKIADETTKAEELWQEASTIVLAIADNAQQSRATYYLSASFMQVQDWERARTVAQSIDDGSDEKIRALSQLALSLTQAGVASQAEIAWEEVQTAIEEVSEQDTAYRIYALAQVQAKCYEEAEETASKYLANNPTEKMVVFGSLASNLVKEHLWERSKHIIDLIAKEYDLTDVAVFRLDDILIHISIDLACEAQWDQAKDLAFTIPTKDARCTALMDIVSQLAKAGMSQQAEKAWEETSAICTAQIDTVQASVAAVLVEVFVKVGQIAQAMQIIHTLPDRQTQEYIMEKVAVALARAGQIEEAEEIVRETTSPMRKDTILRSIAIAQTKAGQPEQALATVLLISRMEKQSQALVDLVKTYCQMHQWDFAQKIARQIRSDPLRAEAQRHIIIALVQNGQRKLAENVVSVLNDDYYKEDARCALATTAAQMGASRETAMKYVHAIRKNDRIQQKAECNIYLAAGPLGLMIAAPIALAIEAGSERNDALHNVAIAYARENIWDEAEKMADEMSDLQRRDETWATIAQEFAQAGQWVSALAAFEKIRKIQKSDQQRISVLQVWGTLLTRPADLPVREQIIRLLSKSEEKASLLASIANALAQGDHSLEQIHLTQQVWLQAGTKDDCGYLFAMVRGLLSLDSKMCTGFYESFEWVDTFLTE